MTARDEHPGASTTAPPASSGSSEATPTPAPPSGNAAGEGPGGPHEGPAARTRGRAGLAFQVLGVLLIIASTLVLASAAQDHRRRTEFAERVGYDEAKGHVHRVFPLVLSLGLGGLFVAWTGARLRTRSD